MNLCFMGVWIDVLKDKVRSSFANSQGMSVVALYARYGLYFRGIGVKAEPFNLLESHDCMLGTVARREQGLLL